tara:strand:+ start:7573 stop:8154 length:582 start_codon:yes stop_codon:yes gene_type:complete
VVVGVLGLLGYYYLEFPIIAFAHFSIGVALFGFFVDFRRFKNPSFNSALEKHFGPIMRRSEKLSFSGLPFYALGVALTIYLFPEKIAVLAILFLIFSDPIASIVGVYLGKDRLLPNKTLQGTIAAFMSCFCLSMIYFLMINNNSKNIIIFAFFSAVVGALSELVSAFNIDDNLTIPVLSGGAMTVLNFWFQVL